MPGWKVLAAVAAVAVLIGVPWYFKMVTTPAPGVVPGTTASTSTTKLVIEMTGGFAYVPDVAKRTFEVGYLTDVNLKNSAGSLLCKVDEIGTELTVLRGKIVSSTPSPEPPNRTFNLDGIDVTIPALNSANIPLTLSRPAFPPVPPRPASQTGWSNLQFVPSLIDFHPASRIRSTWRDEVDGRFELLGGTVSATFPTDPSIERADFEFKLGTTSKGNFAATDKVIYTVDVPGTGVELKFAKSKVGTSSPKYTTVRIEPTAAGETVRLKLRGLHGSDSLSSFLPGQEVKDYCAFYSLLTPAPESTNEMVKVIYNGPPGTFAPGKKPSPGYFCMGDWF